MEQNACLSEKAQKLLMQYADGCCGWFGRRQARKLLVSSTAAREFFDGLQGLTEGLKAINHCGANDKAVSLWDRIENRIEQEERAAFYLGERVLERGPVRSSFGWWQSWLIGAPAGAVVALLAIIGTGQHNQKNDFMNSIGQQIAYYGGFENSNLVVPVAHSVRNNTATSELELEWLRSHGRVQMIQPAQGQVPVIWINRAEAIRQWQQAQRNSNAPLATRNSNGIEIIEREVPTALSVVGER